MALRECKQKGCKSRNKKAVWLVDKEVFCYNCFEVWMETHSFDEHRIHRLSEREEDFPSKTFMPTEASRRRYERVRKPARCAVAAGAQ